MGTRKRIAPLAVALLAGAALGSPGTVMAASEQSSCMGHEASSLSPPGSSDESPRGMRDFGAYFRGNFPGTPQGYLMSTIAGLHEESHADCDEAIEEAFSG